MCAGLSSGRGFLAVSGRALVDGGRSRCQLHHQDKKVLEESRVQLLGETRGGKPRNRHTRTTAYITTKNDWPVKPVSGSRRATGLGLRDRSMRSMRRFVLPFPLPSPNRARLLRRPFLSPSVPRRALATSRRFQARSPGYLVPIVTAAVRLSGQAGTTCSRGILGIRHWSRAFSPQFDD